MWRQGGAFGVTIVVKATFALVHEGSAQLAAPAAIVREDRYRGAAGGLDEASEVAPYLPSVGVIFHGSAHAPPGQPTPAMSVRLGIFGEGALLDKTLHVFGHRPLDAPGSPRPFEHLPVVYERAFGGPRVEDNPVGTGAAPGSPLPNIVDPQKQQRPAGLGPLSKRWGARRRLLGAVDAASLERPIVDIPAGLGWAWFHAAPADQQLAFLRGDEWIVLDGLHPSLPHVQTRLPSAQAHGRWHLAGASGPGPERPLDLRADTLVITPEAGVFSLIWRGHVIVDEADAARMRVAAGVELTGHAPIASDHEAATSGAATSVRGSTGDTPSASGDSDDPLTGTDHAPTEKINARAAEMAGDAPGDPLNQTERIVISKLQQPALPFREGPATPGVTGATGARPPLAPAVPPPRRSGLVASLGETRPASGPPSAEPLPFRAPASGPPSAQPLPFRAPARALADEASATGMIDVRKLAAGALAPFSLAAPGVRAEASPAIPGAPWSAVPASCTPADLGEGTLPEASSPVPRSEPSAPELRPSQEPPPPARMAPPPPAMMAPPPPAMMAPPPPAMMTPPPSTPGTPDSAPAQAPPAKQSQPRQSQPGDAVAPGAMRDKVAAALAANEPLDGFDLTGADLRELDLRGRSLARCKLKGAILKGVDLSGAVLEGAQMSEADLTGAVLDGATLAGADLSGASLEGASFKGVRAEGSVWERATLSRANLSDAKLEGANLRRTTCLETDFSRADLTDADLMRLSGDGANLAGANLAGASLRKAQMLGASFVDAVLRKACADKAELSRSRFDRADLTGASLRTAILKGAVFAQAKLEGADLRDADLERANLFGATRQGAKMTGANTKDLSEADPDRPA